MHARVQQLIDGIKYAGLPTDNNSMDRTTCISLKKKGVSEVDTNALKGARSLSVAC